ncbi:longitudinals lacking protein, isoforms H/M/V isoform X2 [Hermetia illucens]|uniref:longitudinals lacking protein, isoforms H/M/V isoform X2 n=1 Tax=Hermetia illucens TaxID=343691 RepID=UPI0018CC61D4|nr:longitudinals lacking protein, isoforms H/M/V isoform X2 [Hermetia illucens]
MAVRSHQYFSLRWNNYQSTMTTVFQQLREDQSFVDVTLSCEHGSIKAHKVVLSACSTYFQKLLLENPCKHPTVILPSDIVYADLKTIIDFVYRGEIDVTESELQGLLRTAEQLKIKGLCETTDQLEESAPETALITVPLSESEEAQQSQSNINASNAICTVTQQTSNTSIKKSRVRKRSKSPDINAHNNETNQQAYSSSSTVGFNSPISVVSTLSPIGTAPVGTVSSVDIHPTQQHHHNTHQQQQTQNLHQQPNLSGTSVNNRSHDSSSPSVKPTKIIKTEDISNNDVNSNAQTSGTILTQIVVSRDKDSKTMASLGMGINGGLLGVPMGFLDFAPEPPAPSATPVTEQVDMSCTPSTDTRDLSNPTESLDIDNHIAQHIIQRLDQSPIEQMHPSTTSEDNKISQHLIQNIKTEIVDKQHSHQQQQQMQSQSQQQGHQGMSGNTVMEIDPNNIKHEPAMIITPEIVTMMTTGNMDIYNSDTSEDSLMIANGSSNDNNEPQYTNLDQQDIKLNGPKTWTPEDMNSALEALKNHNMSLTKASVTYGIPSTTLWQRAHRMGIDTPKKEGTTKSWNEEALNNALEALRTGQISANKASKAYGIPSSTLYKIARREGIRLAAPFNAAPTTWTPEDLERALEAIRSGQTSVQKASTEFGIPTGTLYGRCKREGIELSRSNPTPWSEDAMNEALVAVRVGHMSINQAAIHYNLPYSSLYGRFKRGKYDAPTPSGPPANNATNTSTNMDLIDNSPENSPFQYTPGPQTAHQQQPQQHQIQQSSQPPIHLQHQHHLQQHTQHSQLHPHQPPQQHHQQHIQQLDVTSSSQVHTQPGQIHQIQYHHHHSTPERS